jgi:ubiquinone/menaquinone biosynthesis C-methylase UbiE
MGFYTEQIVPRIAHFSLNVEPIRKVRAEAIAEARGVVLDVGFGSGLNLPYYPSFVKRVLAVEPSVVARKMAEAAIKSATIPVEFIGLDGQHLTIDDESVDCVVTTWTLCTIPDPSLALQEFARVLKPGGNFLFIEHGKSPEESVSKWQNRLDGLQVRLAAGCHLNRPIEELVASSPLKISSMKNFYNKGPRTHSFFYMGSAIKSQP